MASTNVEVDVRPLTREQAPPQWVLAPETIPFEVVTDRLEKEGIHAHDKIEVQLTDNLEYLTNRLVVTQYLGGEDAERALDTLDLESLPWYGPTLGLLETHIERNGRRYFDLRRVDMLETRTSLDGSQYFILRRTRPPGTKSYFIRTALVRPVGVVISVYREKDEQTLPIIDEEALLLGEARGKSVKFATPPNDKSPLSDLVPSDELSIQVPLPDSVAFGELSDKFVQPLEAINFVYLVFAILGSNSPDAITPFLELLRKHPNVSELQRSDLQDIFGMTKLYPLRVGFMHYGSPAFADIFGIAQSLEVISKIIKQLAWQGGHEKLVAELERKNMQADLNKARLEMQKFAGDIEAQRLELKKKSLELASQELDLLIKIKNLPLSDKDKHLVASVLVPKMEVVAQSEITLLPRVDDENM